MADKWNLDGVSVDTQDNMTVTNDLTVGGDITGNVSRYVIFPTSDPEVVGAVWNNSGTLTISAG